MLQLVYPIERYAGEAGRYQKIPSTNEVVTTNRLNKYAGANLKRKVQTRLCTCFAEQTKAKIEGHVNLRVRFYEPDRRRDEDNVIAGLKFIQDALVCMKILKDDSQRYVHVLPEVFVDTENPRIEVDIEETGK